MQDLTFGTYEVQNNTQITISFYKGEVVYSGVLSRDASGAHIVGIVKDGSTSWSFRLNQQPTSNRMQMNLPLIFTGTGALIDHKQRLIITNCHVVGDADEVLVSFPELEKDGRPVSQRDLYKRKPALRGKVVHREEKVDLALVQLSELPPAARALPVARSSPWPGQQVHSVGNPGSSRALWIYAPGRVRQVYHDKWQIKDPLDEVTVHHYEAWKVETDSPINPGDSGGPLVNDRGVLVGVCHGVNLLATGMSHFIDVREVHAVLERYYQQHLHQKWVPEPEPAETIPLATITDWIKKLSDEDATKRVQAAEALGNMGEGARLAFSSLFEALKDKNPLVRRAAAQALEKVPPHKDDLGLLREACKSKREPAAVRVQAARALAKLGPQAHAALPELVGLLKEQDDEVRLAALEAVVAIGPEAKDAAVLAEGLQSSNPQVVKLTTQILGRLGPAAKGALPTLLTLVKEGQPAVLLEAIRALEAIGPEAKDTILPVLLDVMRRSDRDVALACAKTLAHMGENKDTMPVLTEALKQGSSEQKRTAMHILALTKVENKAAVSALVRCVEDEGLRQEASDILVQLGKIAAPAVASRLTRSQDAQARAAYIDILRRIGTRQRLGPYLGEVQKALFIVGNGDPDRANREAAQKAYREIAANNS